MIMIGFPPPSPLGLVRSARRRGPTGRRRACARSGDRKSPSFPMSVRRLGEVLETLKKVEKERQHEAARIIQRSWKRFLDICVFQHFKILLKMRKEGDPRLLMRCIDPKEAELLDAAAGINIRFRLGGVKYPPTIYYKIFTQRPIVDLCAHSPRDYTKRPAKQPAPKEPNGNLEDASQRGWYQRIENNGWRPLSIRFWRFTDPFTLADNERKVSFHFSKLKRREDVEKRRKLKKIKWMQHMYYAGSLKAKEVDSETQILVQKATEGIIKSIEVEGVENVMEWEVDEILKWTNTLNFDEYITYWKKLATSSSSAPFQDFRLELYGFTEIPLDSKATLKLITSREQI
ncbi:protein MFI [Tachyglossus aculeatus]|uniref:protein MFI n=1 Tax=Tachyglossus aculeatus TaxID=9261 RepID=UPI0018F2CCC9|nr:protein MFI [Tachyglossus aculeatus]